MGKTVRVPDILKVPNRNNLSYSSQEFTALKVTAEMRFVHAGAAGGASDFRNESIEGMLSTPISNTILRARRELFSEIMSAGRKTLFDVVREIPSVFFLRAIDYEGTRENVRRAQKLVDFPVTLQKLIELHWKSDLYNDVHQFCIDFLGANKKFVEITERIREKWFTCEDVSKVVSCLQPYQQHIETGKYLKEQLMTYLLFAYLCEGGCLPEFRSASENNGKIVQGTHPNYGRWKDNTSGLMVYSPSVPNNVDWDDKSRVTLITGSNSRGKSVYLRMIGFNVLLAMNGFYALAHTMELSPIRRVWPCFDIGDELGAGHLETGQKYIARMRDNATKDDILLIDEPAQGTEPATEYLLAKGLVNFVHLSKMSAFVVTHDLALVSEFKGAKGIAFKRVADYADEEHKYILSSGIADGGYGLRLAKKLGTDPESLQKAARKRKMHGR